MKLEKEIEQKFCEYAKSKGCYPVKFEDPARRGAPDRMVLCPGGQVFFIEFKNIKGAPRQEQSLYMSDLSSLGFYVTWASKLEWSMDELDSFLDNF